MYVCMFELFCGTYESVIFQTRARVLNNKIQRFAAIIIHYFTRNIIVFRRCWNKTVIYFTIKH